MQRKPKKQCIRNFPKEREMSVGKNDQHKQIGRVHIHITIIIFPNTHKTIEIEVLQSVSKHFAKHLSVFRYVRRSWQYIKSNEHGTAHSDDW